MSNSTREAVKQLSADVGAGIAVLISWAAIIAISVPSIALFFFVVGWLLPDIVSHWIQPKDPWAAVVAANGIAWAFLLGAMIGFLAVIGRGARAQAPHEPGSSNGGSEA